MEEYFNLTFITVKYTNAIKNKLEELLEKNSLAYVKKWLEDNWTYISNNKSIKDKAAYFSNLITSGTSILTKERKEKLDQIEKKKEVKEPLKDGIYSVREFFGEKEEKEEFKIRRNLTEAIKSYVDDFLENVEKIRILIGINVDEKTLIINNVAKSFDGKDYYFTPKEIKKFTKTTIKQEMENSEDNYNVDFGTKKFIEFIENGKIEIRVYSKEKIHAKVYIMRKNLEKSEDYGKVVTGSSNFSYSGLRGNLEFNVELKNHSDVEFALNKFEELWEQGIPLNQEYASTLKNETWIREDIKPYELYFKFLFEYFSEEINEDKIKVNTSDLPEGFITYKYQLDAVNQAKRMLSKYNGVFLADVVGLGKTYITALLARELYGGNKLIICPPVLKNYWEDVLRDFGVVAKVVSLGKLDEILDNYNSEYFKYIFIDEAHRFRSDNTESYSKLSKI